MTEQRAAAKQATGQPAVRQAFAACNVAYGTSQDQRLVLVRDPPTRTPTPDTRPRGSSFFFSFDTRRVLIPTRSSYCVFNSRISPWGSYHIISRSSVNLDLIDVLKTRRRYLGGKLAVQREEKKTQPEGTQGYGRPEVGKMPAAITKNNKFKIVQKAENT